MARPIREAFLGGVTYGGVLPETDLNKLDHILLKRKSYKIINANFMQWVSRGAVVEEPHPRLRELQPYRNIPASVENFEVLDRIELEYDDPTDAELREQRWLERCDRVHEYRKPKKMLTDKAVSKIIREAEECTK